MDILCILYPSVHVLQSEDVKVSETSHTLQPIHTNQAALVDKASLLA
jgi:hypothetical protein